MGQENTRVATPSTQYLHTQVSPTSPPQTQPHFSCELPTQLPPVLTRPEPHTSDRIRQLVQPNPDIMPPSSFKGGEVQMDIQNAESASTSAELDECRPRRETFKYSHDTLLQSTSQAQEPTNDPRHLIGYQEDPQL